MPGTLFLEQHINTVNRVTLQSFWFIFITIVLIKVTVPCNLLFTKIPNRCNEVGKTVYQSRTNEEFYNILAREFVFSEEYCYWHVSKEENGRKEVEMCADLSQDPLLAKLTRMPI